MISQIDKKDSIESFIPIFKNYLNYMSQFYDIKNISAWQEKAVKNLKQDVTGKDCLIYILKNNTDIVGFSVVNRHLRFNTSGRAIAEFYIQKDYQRKGHGREMAEYIFSQFEGYWEVSVSAKNDSARMFWEKVISSYASDEYMAQMKYSINDYGFIFNRKAA